MCIILDASMFGRFNKRDKGKQDRDMEPVWNWLDEEHGKIVYSNTGKFRKEWLKGGMKAKMMVLNRTGKLKLVSAQDVQEKVDALEQTGILRSDDPHIIALARIAKVKVLVSNDKTLNADFRNRNLVGGKVYHTEADSNLLTKDTCP